VRSRPAELADLALIQRWRQERVEWLRCRGSDQWSESGLTGDDFAHRVAESIAARGTWILERNGIPVGTIAVDTMSDPGLWSPAELDGAYVLHRMIVPTAAAGTGVGDALLAHADALARARGKKRLILDAWTSNAKLHAYYEKRGFRRVRTVENHWTPSAALFERIL